MFELLSSILSFEAIVPVLFKLVLFISIFSSAKIFPVFVSDVVIISIFLLEVSAPWLFIFEAFSLEFSITLILLVLVIEPAVSTSRFDVNISPEFVNTPIYVIFPAVFRFPVFDTAFVFKSPPTANSLLFCKSPDMLKSSFTFTVP